MTKDDAVAALGGLIALLLVVAAVVVALAVVAVAGAAIGGWFGLVNYFKAFRDNVRLERPGGL